MMTNISTFEDALENILGLVLGAPAGQYELATSGSGGGPSGGKSSINNAFRPATVKGPGFWLIAQSSTLDHTGGWAPEYDKDAVTFYKWTQDGATKDITRLTVWVGVVNRDNAQGQTSNTDDPNAVVNGAANPVIALGSAWETVRNEIPAVAGVGSSFDPNTIEAIREIFGGLATHANTTSSALTKDVTSVNTKSSDFSGSAESAWYHRVITANHYLSDLATQQAGWDTTLKAVEDAMNTFITALNKAMTAWGDIEPKNTWHNPYRVIAAQFNEGTLQKADVHNGTSQAWDLGSQYADTNSQKTSNGKGGGTTTTNTETILWNPPAWVKVAPFDAFDTNAWSTLDNWLRQTWADNLTTTFAPVVTAAGVLVKAFADARNPLSLVAPQPVPPLPMPNNLGLPNGSDSPFPNYGDPFANWGDPFANFGNPFANFGNPFANFGDPFANFGDPFANFGNPFANMGNPFANSGGGDNNPFANTPNDQFAVRSENPFANTPDNGFVTQSANPFGGGGNDPFANSPLSSTFLPQGSDSLPNGPDSGLLLSRTANPFANSSDPFANSAGGGPFLRSVDPFANSGSGFDGGSGFGGGNGLGGANGLGGVGGVTGLDTPQTLGDLTPAQLRQLDAAGLLNNVPLTPQQEAFLSSSGLGVPSGAGPTLGQLTPKQLSALQQAGLLDQTPLTSAERSTLGLPSLATSPSKLAIGSGLPVDSNPFPTTVNGLDVSGGTKLAGGSKLGSGAGLTLGDVSKAGAGSHPSLPGLVAGTGGLSSMPGVTGKLGGLSSSGLSLPVGSGSGSGSGIGSGSGLGSGLGTGSGVGSSGLPGGAGGAGEAGGAGGLSDVSAGDASSPYGGMPFMPPMMGGGGQGKQDRERQRNTWLKEDEKVWGTDPDCAPAVIGRRGKPARVEDDEYTPETDERPGTRDERRPYRGR